MLYFEWDKITHSKKAQVPRPKSQEPKLPYHPAWNLELGIWNLRLNECGNLSRFKYNTKVEYIRHQFYCFSSKQFLLYHIKLLFECGHALPRNLKRSVVERWI
jgi:hypothetical protein